MIASHLKHRPELSCGLPFGNLARTWRTPSTCRVFHFAGGLPQADLHGASGSAATCSSPSPRVAQNARSSSDCSWPAGSGRSASRIFGLAADGLNDGLRATPLEVKQSVKRRSSDHKREGCVVHTRRA